ncbi:MAG: photosystem II protein Y [Dolichospermum sp.]
MDIYTRLVIVLSPLAIADIWSAFNIVAYDIRQVQNFLSKEAQGE